MKRIVHFLSKSAASFFILLFLSFLVNTKTSYASDLMVFEILVPGQTADCNEPFHPVFTICNINIYDAYPGEWVVHVVIRNELNVIVFEEMVDGVFLGKGSVNDPTCITMETVNPYTPDASGVYTIEVTVDYVYDIDPENDVLIEEFIVECPLGSIGGQVWEDLENHTVKDPGEIGVDGVIVELYDDNKALVDQMETYSEDLDDDGEINPEFESGLFLFDSLAAGEYTLVMIVPDEWEQTFPLPPGNHIVNLEPGSHLDGFLFGIFFPLLLFDYGDLPDPYDPIPPFIGPGYFTLKPLGPRHPTIGPFLGVLRDSEPNGQPSFLADGDDFHQPPLGFWDDEDGVRYIAFTPSGIDTIEVTVGGNPADFPCWLSGWIDFNGNTTFQFAEMIIFTNIPRAGTYRIAFTVPPDAMRGQYSRFRVSTSWFSVLFPFGIALNGEVEDYVLFGVDFGDANQDGDTNHPEFPEGYPVKTLSDGARHIIHPLLRLGDEWTDFELDGIPSYYSNGDDNDNDADEDGIEYGNEFFIHYQGPDPENPARIMTIYGMLPGSTVTIKPLATQVGLLNLWIDWNRDGDWGDTGEHVFTDESIISGPTYTTLTFDVPNDASLGYTYARYRFSRQTGLDYTGFAPNGEVEDHLLWIDTSVTKVENEFEENLPKEYKLYQNYPNPFNPSTSIKYDLPTESQVVITIYNSIGQIVKILFNEIQTAGTHKAEWIVENESSGVYFYNIEAKSVNGTREFKGVKKMVLIR